MVDRFFFKDDASQCMRVSSALEAGTVSIVSPQPFLLYRLIYISNVGT